MKAKVQGKVYSYGVLKVGEIFTIISDHNHGGKKIKIEDISTDDNIIGAGGRRYRNIHGRLLNTNTRINLIPLQIQEVIDDNLSRTDYRTLSKLSIVLLAKKGDKKAVIEFVRRFKKMPNIKRK